MKGAGLWALEIVLALFFALQGLEKLTGSPVWVARFASLGYPTHFYLVAGAMELAGAVALVLPSFRLSGTCLLGVVMLGATLSHALHGQIQALTTVVLLALLLADAWARRRRAAQPSAPSSRS